jgi:hypothetical protein
MVVCLDMYRFHLNRAKLSMQVQFPLVVLNALLVTGITPTSQPNTLMGRSSRFIDGVTKSGKRNARNQVGVAGTTVADTRVQVEVERWVREHWLPQAYGQPFRQRQLTLSSGGKFVFDAVSDDGRVVVTVSTSGAKTATGRHGAGKLQKIRADALFLLLSAAREPALVFTERDMFELCQREAQKGRLPAGFKIILAQIPVDLQKRLQQARLTSSREVSPGMQTAIPRKG